MLLIGLRDLQWRRRRFAVAVLATGLVLGMALLLTGLGASFSNEVDRAIDAFDADQWLVREGAAGPFGAPDVLPASVVDDVAAVDGVERADGVVVGRLTVGEGTGRDVNLVGIVPGGIGTPDLVAGRLPGGRGEVVGDRLLGWDLDDEVEVRGVSLVVVGQVEGLTFLGGVPTMIVTLEQAQELALGGLPLVSTVGVRGTPVDAPEGMAFVSDEQARADLARPLENASGSVDFVTVLLWVVAAGIVGTILYLSAIERLRDFAVLKAVGASTASIVAGLAVQAVVLALVAAAIGVLLAFCLAPLFPMLVELEAWSVVALPVIAVIVALLASLAGLRRAVSVDPGLAFGGR